ncbi:hypothetical protein FXO37_15508 [Capsicum annuum]|nr:hypothetical protein FXO37_15508 [Capsicum annuum]
MRKKRTEKRKTRTLPVDDDEVEDAFAAFIFFNALIRSIHARLIIASSMISLISFWSAASKDNLLGGLGGFLPPVDLRLSFTFLLSMRFSAVTFPGPERANWYSITSLVAGRNKAVCRLHSLSQSNGATTTQHKQLPRENTGFTFVGCKITGVKSAILGKPWGTYARVVFVQTYTSSVILPNGMT